MLWCSKTIHIQEDEHIRNIKLQQEVLYETNISIYKHKYFFTSLLRLSFFAFCAFQLQQTISLESIYLEAIMCPRSGSTQRRNYRIGPHYLHYTTNWTERHLCKPVMHVQLRFAIQYLFCNIVVFPLVHSAPPKTCTAQVLTLLIKCRCVLHALWKNILYSTDICFGVQTKRQWHSSYSEDRSLLTIIGIQHKTISYSAVRTRLVIGRYAVNLVSQDCLFKDEASLFHVVFWKRSVPNWKKPTSQHQMNASKRWCTALFLLSLFHQVRQYLNAMVLSHA